jgi:hypothetical protein
MGTCFLVIAMICVFEASEQRRRSFGRIINHHIESPWMTVSEPTTLNGHRVWVRDELKWARLGPEQ